jgi:hypothetical protein|tara:strand:- start:232 stop:2061 length:1830 start_codon:yes stop_codon:yes gene_type:complete
LKVGIVGSSIPDWNEEVAFEFFKEFTIHDVLDKKKQIRLGTENQSVDDINNILDSDEIKSRNVGKGFRIADYRKIYKDGLDKVKETTIGELIEGEPLKEKFVPLKEIESLMDKAPKELSRAVLARILESPTDEKDTKIALKEGIDNYDSYFNSLYEVTEKESKVKNGTQTTKTVRINELDDFRNGAKFKKLVELGFTNITIKGENKDGQSYNLIEELSGKVPAGDISSRRGGFPKEEEERGTTAKALDLQEIPLYLINRRNNSLRKIEEGSSIDPLILEAAVKYDKDNQEEVDTYKFVDGIPNMLKGLEKTILNELRKEMIDIERELEDKSIYEDKETESGKRIKEGSKFAPKQSEVMGLAKKKKVSKKVADEIVELHNKLEKIKEDRKEKEDAKKVKEIPFEEIIGIGMSGINYSSAEDITEKIPYQVFFKGQNKSIESTLSAGNYVASIKEGIIKKKAEFLDKEEENIYSDSDYIEGYEEKIKSMKVNAEFTDGAIYQKSKEFLQKVLMRYLNDLEYVFDIEFIVTKTTKTTNKTEKNPKGKTNTTYKFKRLNAKRKQIIFKGGGLNPNPKKKREATRILESKTNTALLNTFINSIRGNIDTLERGI